MNSGINAWDQLPAAPLPGTLVCAAETLLDGVPRFFTFGPEASPFRVIALRSGPTLRGYVNRCAHFGVPLAARESQLIYVAHQTLSCNVHYARFRWQDGYCEYGDCRGESLLPVPLHEAAGEIRIGAASTADG